MTPKPYLRFRLRLAGQIGAALSLAVLIVCGGAALAQGPGRPQAPAQQEFRGPSFRAVSYDVYASLSPADQTLTGRATVEFESRQASGTVECELHPNLRVTAVRDASGKMLQFDRDGFSSLGVRVILDNPLPAGQRVKLTYEYSGLLANEENSPVKGVRLAWIGKDGAYLLLPARWFPLTDYPSNRYTGTFHIEVPQSFVVVGTGTSAAPAPAAASAPPPPPLPSSGTGSIPPALRRRNSQGPAPAPAPSATATITSSGTVPAPAAPSPGATSRLVYTFRVDHPEAAGTFVAGALRLNSVQAEGLDISVYAPPAAPAVQAHGEAVARIVNVFSDQFGPLSAPNLTLAQIPDATVASYAAPGLLLLSQRQWLATPNTRLLSNLVASQWWGDQVQAATPSDAWLTVGMSRYAEALYLEQTAGKEGMNRALEDAAVGALMYESAAPIAEAGNLEPFTPNYDSVVANKGSMVFHMLRGQLGDPAFFSLLRDFLMQYSGKAASIDDFEKMAEARADKLAPPASASASSGFILRPDGASAPPASEAPAGAVNLRPFFAQWVHSTGVPEFTFDYTMYRTKGGFKLIGKVKQNLDFFRMPVEVEVLTEGNPEYKIISVSGTETSFDLDVFGRPKSNGILLDPHNYILKSSAPLRVRAVIAKGEAFAEAGRYYDAIQQYNQALDIEKNNALATFRTGEAFFYQRNYSAAANAFRDTLDGNFGLNDKWVEVWSHIYLGKIYDISGDRPRAVNEYSKAQQTNDNTGGAQDEAQKYITKAYSAAPSGN